MSGPKQKSRRFAKTMLFFTAGLAPLIIGAGIVLAVPGVIAGGDIFHPASDAANTVGVPNAAFETSTPDSAPGTLRESAFSPHLIIPSIKLDDPIIPVGLNAKGEMDVPDGSTNNVGWYKDGPNPGSPGTAVLDAHVFAAFSDLKYVNVGDSIYVTQKNVAPLHFIVTKKQVYPLADLTSVMLFGGDGTARMNLITCAGSFQKEKNTYDHRLVVYTQLVK